MLVADGPGGERQCVEVSGRISRGIEPAGDGLEIGREGPVRRSLAKLC